MCFLCVSQSISWLASSKNHVKLGTCTPGGKGFPTLDAPLVPFEIAMVLFRVLDSRKREMRRLEGDETIDWN